MKLLASDFDNTLLFDNQMKDNDVKAIHQFQEEGHLFGICSGRSLEGILRPSVPYGIDYDFYILLSGALIVSKKKEVLFEKKVPLSLVKEIFAFLNEKDLSVVVEDTMYKIFKTKEKDHHGIYLNSLDELKVENVNAFSFHFAEDEIELATFYTQKIHKQYGDVIEAYQNNRHIDLAAKGCSKGQGIQFIQDYFHLPKDNIYAIGDSWNDLPMLDAVKNSYTFTYADDKVKNHALHIVSSLAKCIEDIQNEK